MADTGADTGPVSGLAVLIRRARTSRTATMATVQPRITTAAPSSVVCTPIAALSGPTGAGRLAEPGVAYLRGSPSKGAWPAGPFQRLGEW